MKMPMVCLAMLLSLVACGGGEITPLSTNVVLYTNIHSPTGTSHYYATPVEFVISNGLIVALKDLGEIDLYSKLPAAEAKRIAADLERRGAARGAELRERLLKKKEDQKAARGDGSRTEKENK